MRNAVVGGFMGVLFGCVVLIACGGGGGSGGPSALVIGESVLAAAQVDGSATTPIVNRFVNHLGASVTATRVGAGIYDLNFGFDVSSRFFSVCPGRDAGLPATQVDLVVTVLPHATDPNKATVAVYDMFTDALTDNGYFYITVF